MARTMMWNAVLLAGSRPSGDAEGGSLLQGHKALLEIAGEPMFLRPLRALLASPKVGTVRVMAQDSTALRPFIAADPRVQLGASADTIAATVAQLVTAGDARFPVLVTTADHALLTPAMIDEFMAHAAGADLAIGVVEAKALLARFPTAKRTWIGFKGGRYSGANLFAFGSARAAPAIDSWRGVEQRRKKGWRLLQALGPSLLLGAVLKLRTIEQTAAAIGAKLGVDVRIVQLSDPLAAVDVDKPDDHKLVEAILAGRT